ncbi:hypothetical protein [Aurantibacillus circumpalustris]|uniref:hypothetical protein n=1 Tax=Aurantibacillus circumpalustris TaxID=3036359 RepID=UPI00295B1777|nr:hypothetical protein [Aurantibacillus circumpalustris]
MSESVEEKNQLVINYMTLRWLTGLLGIIQPIGLIIYSLVKREELQISISHYYHTGMRDFFVGTLCMTSLFLFSYNGYNKKDKRDFIASKIASICGLGVAFFPTTYKTPGICLSNTDTIGYIHLACACGFFLTLAFFSLFLFTESDKKKENWTLEKKTRNKIYKFCGIVMIMCVLIIIAYLLPHPKCDLYDLKPVFWCEAVALWFFGLSWFVKGEAILGDKAKHS